jgi:hypothetical protein
MLHDRPTPPPATVAVLDAPRPGQDDHVLRQISDLRLYLSNLKRRLLEEAQAMSELSQRPGLSDMVAINAKYAAANVKTAARYVVQDAIDCLAQAEAARLGGL